MTRLPVFINMAKVAPIASIQDWANEIRSWCEPEMLPTALPRARTVPCAEHCRYGTRDLSSIEKGSRWFICPESRLFNKAKALLLGGSVLAKAVLSQVGWKSLTVWSAVVCDVVAVKEFTLNRCPSRNLKDGQMMTPDRESYCGVMSPARFPDHKLELESMTNTWVLSALWVGLALVATLFAIWFRVSTALSEIVVGTVAQLIIGALLGRGGLLGNTEWITFLAGTGAIVLIFLAGAELDPTTISRYETRIGTAHRYNSAQWPQALL
jgi:hypothetical protein